MDQWGIVWLGTPKVNRFNNGLFNQLSVSRVHSMVVDAIIEYGLLREMDYMNLMEKNNLVTHEDGTPICNLDWHYRDGETFR